MNNKLTRQQKEAVALLTMGTFLEYFDVLLYIHMAVLLNDLFFPQTDPLTAQLFTATAFCSTYILRPIGGFVIGRIGDSIGRKPTIMITTFVMAISCLVMAGLPTYTEIGITASVVIIVCRMLQGFSSMGEIMGAQIYLTEILKPPARSVATGILVSAEAIGGFFALVVASFVLSMGMNWRYAFLFGAFIAGIGLVARTRLRETPEFVDYKRRMAVKREKSCQEPEIIKNIINEERVDKKAIFAYAFTEFHYPVCFYVTYIYIGNLIKTSFGMSAEQVIYQNLKVSAFVVIGALIVAYLVKKIHPIKIAIVMALFFFIILPFIPYWLNNASGLFSLLCLQCLIMSFIISGMGTLEAVQCKHFPVSGRFTVIAATFGVASTSSKIIVAFSLIPLTHYLGHYGVWVVFIPAVIGYWWAINYFKKLEIKRGAYHNYPHEDPPYEDTAVNEDDYEYEDLGDEYEPFKNKCEYSTNLINKLNEFSKEKNVKLNMRLIEKAVTFAKKWHGTQMRKTGSHFFYWHPLKVAEMVAESYCKTDMVIAAILHDTVEDSECTVELIEERFNARIAQMVDRLTKKRFEGGENIKLSFEETINRLQSVGDIEALFIKQMDRQHNLETIEGLKPHKQQKMADETNSYFIKLIAIIGDKLNIHGKIHLENKMFKSCKNIIKKKKG